MDLNLQKVPQDSLVEIGILTRGIFKVLIHLLNYFQENFINLPLHIRDSVINYHKLDGLKYQKFCLSQFLEPELEIKIWAAPSFLWRFQGSTLICLSQFLVGASNSWWCLVYGSIISLSASIITWPSSLCISVSPNLSFLVRTSVFGCRITLIQCNLLLIMIASTKTLIPHRFLAISISCLLILGGFLFACIFFFTALGLPCCP